MMHVSLDAIDRVQRVVGSLSLINERPLPPRDGGCGRLVRDGKALVDEPGRFDLINERNSVILARTTCQKPICARRVRCLINLCP